MMLFSQRLFRLKNLRFSTNSWKNMVEYKYKLPNVSDSHQNIRALCNSELKCGALRDLVAFVQFK